MESLFKDLPTRNLNRGQILIYEGDPVDNIYYLVSGYVKVSNILMDGSQRTIFIYVPGDAFPLTSFLSGSGVARYFYECMTGAEIKVMPQDDFQEMIKDDLAIGESLISYTYDLNAQFVERIETLTARSARHKVASMLVYLSERAGVDDEGMTRLQIPLTSQNIADMCNLTRETASLQLIKLKKEGFVSGGRLLLVNKSKLRKLLGS